MRPGGARDRHVSRGDPRPAGFPLARGAPRFLLLSGLSRVAAHFSLLS